MNNEHESIYAAAGGGLCMYCGTRHSSALECRPMCTEDGCTRRGIPWKVGDETSPPKCMQHKPGGAPGQAAEPMPVPPPKEEQNA